MHKPWRARPAHQDSRRISSQTERWLSIVLIGIMMALSIIVVASEFPQSQAIAQTNAAESASQRPRRLRRSDIWKEVHRQLPELPREDQYISQNGGGVSSSTLVTRLIEYHNFRKGRSPLSRFDWKLTLADYLGLNEPIIASSYPGAIKLTQNPMAGDMAALGSLSREQRQQLVNTLVSLYNPRIPEEFFTPAPLDQNQQREDAADPSPVVPELPRSPSRPTLPPLSEPGAADLLRLRS